MDTEDDELRSSVGGCKLELGAGNRVADLNRGELDDDGDDCGGICWLVKIDDTFTGASLSETNCTLASNDSHKRASCKKELQLWIGHSKF